MFPKITVAVARQAGFLVHTLQSPKASSLVGSAFPCHTPAVIRRKISELGTVVHISCTSYRDRFTAHFAIAVTEAQVSFPAHLCDNAREGVYFLRIFLVFLRQGSLEANCDCFFSVRISPYGPFQKRCIFLFSKAFKFKTGMARVPYNKPFSNLARATLGNIGPRSFLDGARCALSVLPQLRANIPQYGPRTRLVKGY